MTRRRARRERVAVNALRRRMRLLRGSVEGWEFGFRRYGRRPQAVGWVTMDVRPEIG